MTLLNRTLLSACFLFSLCGCVSLAQDRETSEAPGPGRQLIFVRSTRDDSIQPSYIILPPDYKASGPAVPLVVALHTWSYTLEQRFQEFETGTTRRNWVYLFPNFRGIDDHPEACGSELAQQDVLDAVQWTRSHLKVDDKRIYLWGWSGGGHMALLMASRQPDLWTAVSAWAGITDMAAYYRERLQDRPPTTTDQLRGCFGAAPGTNTDVDAQYSARSPVTSIARAARVPIDIWNGRDDNDVSFTHAVLAFNRLAEATGSALISTSEIAQLTQTGNPVSDANLGRDIYLRRTAGPSRVTIYLGSHETIAAPTFEWFEKHVKP